MNATLVQPLPSWFTCPARVLDMTLPANVRVCPANVPAAGSTYMLASMLLLPTAPGPPLGVYQKGLGSPIVLGDSVRVEPENVAQRSGVPQPPPKTKPPPFCGVSNTFMNPIHGALGSTVTEAACAWTADQRTSSIANPNAGKCGMRGKRARKLLHIFMPSGG